MKCKVVKVAVFGYQGKDYKPGDIVEVPKRFATLDFLEPVKEKPEKLEPKTEQTTEEKPEKPRKRA